MDPGTVCGRAGARVILTVSHTGDLSLVHVPVVEVLSEIIWFFQTTEVIHYEKIFTTQSSPFPSFLSV